MTYFMRIELDADQAGASEVVARFLDDGARGDHQLLWHFFPGPQGSRRDFLFRRFEPRGGRSQALYYCVARRPAIAPHPVWRVESRSYEPRVRTGDRLQFDLRLNPTRAHERNGKSRRDDVVMHAKKGIMAKHGVTRWQDVPESHRPPLYELIHDSIHEWLGDSSRPGIAARNGFHVLKDLSVDAYRQHRILRDGGKPMQITTVDLSGVLEVDDPTLFTDALIGGIGHAKAFGCGLLLVRRAN